ncbi:uncharacterized protein majin [Nelusetta ayraudi]|uniref:uncharacterized protein majin n=1 Tax=Nelusetta ayraudi TaxID=303726 RepID=UPI003F7191A2
MSLQAFSFPVCETRFLKAGSFIYNFNIIAGSSFSGKETAEDHCFSPELEDIIRTVIGNLDNFQPFSSANFNVFPYKKLWQGVSQMMCKHCWRGLKAYPYILILYLEKKDKQPEKKLGSKQKASWQLHLDSVPQKKRRKRALPLEDAILKDVLPHLETESNVPVLGLQCGNWHKVEKVRGNPEFAGKTESVLADGHQEAAAVRSITGSGAAPREMQPGTTQGGSKENEDAHEENSDCFPDTPARPGIFMRLTSSIFPLSLFFRKPRLTEETHIQD